MTALVAEPCRAPRPHPDTDPESIARDQRAAVAEALHAFPDSTPDDLSELVCLPVWVVGRRLAELRGEPESRERVVIPPLVLRVEEWLRGHGPADARTVAGALGEGYAAVWRVLANSTNRAKGNQFYAHGYGPKPARGRARTLWMARGVPA